MADKKQEQVRGVLGDMIDKEAGTIAELQAQPKPKDKKDPEAKRAVGVQLKNKEWDRLQEIADEVNATNRHELTVYILRNWIVRYDGGHRPKFKTETRSVLDPSE